METQKMNLFVEELLAEKIIDNDYFKARRLIEIIEQVAEIKYKELKSNESKKWEILNRKKVSEINVKLYLFIASEDEKEIQKAKEQIEAYFENVFQSNQIPMTKKLEDDFLFEVL